MASLTNTGEAMVLDWAFTTTAVTRPTSWTVALYTTTPTDSSAGTEVTGGAYARQAVSFTRSGTSPTQVANSAQIEFPTATANWGTVAGAAVFDNNGNMLAWGEILNPVTGIADPQAINTGNIFRFNAGDLIVTGD
jgi:hypothetical protein